MKVFTQMSNTAVETRPPSLWSQVRGSCPPEKWRADPWWAMLVLRPVSFPVAWMMIRLGLSANQVSVLSAAIAIAGATLMFAGGQPYILLGATLFNIWALLDCVDGNMARIRGTASKHGDFVDTMAGYVAYGLVFLAAGSAASKAGGSMPTFLEPVDFVLMGALASVANLTMRVIFKHYQLMGGHGTESVATSRHQLARQLGPTGFLMPLVLVGILAGALHWIVLFYAAFHIAGLAVVTFRLLRSSKGLEAADEQDMAGASLVETPGG